MSSQWCVCACVCTPVSEFSELSGGLCSVCEISQCCGGLCAGYAGYGVSELFRSLSGVRTDVFECLCSGCHHSEQF